MTQQRKVEEIQKITLEEINGIGFEKEYFFDVLFSGNLEVEKAIDYTRKIKKSLNIEK